MISAPASRDDTVVTPWQVEPLRLWSLLEMLRFYGAAFYTVAVELERVRVALAFKEGDSDSTTKALEIVASLRKEIANLPLPPSVYGRVDRLAQALEGAAVPAPDRVAWLLTLVNELQLDLQLELSQHLFLFVPSSRKWMFLEPEKWFGEDMVAKFHDARLDMRDCARCMVLDQWTASVFHAMAIMEHGLRHLATRVGVTFSVTFDLENWHNVIEQIEAKIKAMKQQPRPQQDSVEITFCSNAASHFFAVKEAWRNHVSHGRGKYDEVEAVRIVNNVRDFMRVLI